jgi:SET domain-containing protein
MLYVKTYVAPSDVHGLGLFAKEFIPKGALVWKFTPGFDQKFTREQILSFPDELQIYLYTYCWKSKKSHLYCFSSDNGKYFNHSKNPNVLSAYVHGEEEVVITAIKDINPGQEITDDYSSFEFETEDDNVLDEICKKFNLIDELDPRFKVSANLIDYNQILKQVENHPRVYVYVSPQTQTKLSPIQGLGLFANQSISKGRVVAAWGGRVTTKAEIKLLPKHISYNYALEIYPGFYLAETKLSDLDSSDFINHSCSPNCKILKKFLMITKRNIRKGEELTADFSNHSNKGQKFICHCGARNCKKVIYFD